MKPKTTDQYSVTIPNWFEHNPKSKKGYTHFMISKSLFQDDKIAQLTPTEFQLYVYLLSICADTVSDSFTISAQLVPRYMRISALLLSNCLARLESFQLLKHSKKGLSYIKEENRKEKNRIEGNVKEDNSSASAPPPSDPFFQKRFSPKELPKAGELWNTHCSPLTKIVSTTRAWNVRSDQLLSDFGEKEFIRAMGLLTSNSFLTGQNRRKWKATFAWFITPENFAKVLNGDYSSESGVESMLEQLRKELEAS